MNELRDIREAMNLSQAAMGKLYGVKQGVYQRWEAAPDSRASREALEKAKGFYLKRFKTEWQPQESPAPAAGPFLTVEAFAEWRGYWKGGMEGVLERLEKAEKAVADLKDQVRKLSPPEDKP